MAKKPKIEMEDPEVAIAIIRQGNIEPEEDIMILPDAKDYNNIEEK